MLKNSEIEFKNMRNFAHLQLPYNWILILCSLIKVPHKTWSHTATRTVCKNILLKTYESKRILGTHKLSSKKQPSCVKETIISSLLSPFSSRTSTASLTISHKGMQSGNSPSPFPVERCAECSPRAQYAERWPPLSRLCPLNSFPWGGQGSVDEGGALPSNASAVCSDGNLAEKMPILSEMSQSENALAIGVIVSSHVPRRIALPAPWETNLACHAAQQLPRAIRAPRCLRETCLVDFYCRFLLSSTMGDMAVALRRTGVN